MILADDTETNIRYTSAEQSYLSTVKLPTYLLNSLLLIEIK